MLNMTQPGDVAIDFECGYTLSSTTGAGAMAVNFLAGERENNPTGSPIAKEMLVNQLSAAMG